MYKQMEVAGVKEQQATGCNRLKSKWVLWAHFPHDTDWSVASYKKVAEFETVESVIAVTQSLPEKLVKNCMLFLMKEGIQPIWEDPMNRDGGCFSFKTHNKDVWTAWNNLTYAVTGESVTSDEGLLKAVNGITISPKKNFCIIKLWLRNCMYQNPRLVIPLDGLDARGCIFKKQTPQY
tara:strand:- start:197 stop:730 length:534 start_codon:yes stop_codon:yes gene_type:complete